MKTVDAEEISEQFLELLDNLGDDGLIITIRGRPIARLLPLEHHDAELIGSLRDKIAVHGNILATGVDWEADTQS